MTTDDEQTVHSSRMAFIEAVAAVVIQTAWRRFLATQMAAALRKDRTGKRTSNRTSSARMSPPRNADVDVINADALSPPRREPQRTSASSPGAARTLDAWKTRQQQSKRPAIQDTTGREYSFSHETVDEPYDVADALATKERTEQQQAKDPAAPLVSPRREKYQELTSAEEESLPTQQQHKAKREPSPRSQIKHDQPDCASNTSYCLSIVNKSPIWNSVPQSMCKDQSKKDGRT